MVRPEYANDFLPTADIERLRRRAQLYQNVRDFFDSRDFFEVETPLLSHDIVVDRHLHPVGIPKSQVTGRTDDNDLMYLQTSPEFAMKRLLAGGADRIYQICKAFRQGESGQQHNPEFTMLEWYRVGDNLQAGMDLLTEFVCQMLNQPSVDRITYRDAFQRHAGFDPFEIGDQQLVELAFQEPLKTKADRDESLNLILARDVEPQLGVDRPVLIFDYPASQAALAKIRDADPPVAERFEIYVNGVELANGYHELLDVEELRRRTAIQNSLRRADGQQPLPESSRLDQAMAAGLPGCVGVALGMDRLAMLALQANSIDQVIAFPFSRA